MDIYKDVLTFVLGGFPIVPIIHMKLFVSGG
jgi:hypothetical protein